MQAGIKKVFYFNTNASALGGYVGEGSKHEGEGKGEFRVIASHASVSLPSAGGSATDKTGKRPTDAVVSCKRSYTHVAGHALLKNGPWVTRATAVVEGLDILNGTLTAKRVVAQIFLEHGVGKGPTLIAFGRSHFDNLRLNGKQVVISLNRTLFPATDATNNDYYDEDAVVIPTIKQPVLYKIAQGQSRSFHAIPKVPSWVTKRHGMYSEGGLGPEDHVLCSVVDKVEVVEKVEVANPIPTYGHVMDVPEVGRFYFGELVMHAKSLQLTMVRAELGCDTTGTVSAASARANGSTWPPTK